MPAEALFTPPMLSEAQPRKRFTCQEVERLLNTGVFDGQRFELIDGDLVDKMGQKPPHAIGIQLVHDWLITFLRLVRVQLPMEAAGKDRERSVPEPDLAVLLEMKAEHLHRHPRGNELLLTVEVADSSAAFDLSRKAVLYAAAGVPEYWVLDLNRRMLVVHRQPDGSQYRLIQMFSEDQVVSLEGRSETVKVGELLPPSA